ncbi:MAG TPA: hypothetical protein VFG60_09845 [Burkholderiaceae bacterium]|nr:hypothetical protein [Burkholderiaceae bacterium]
MSDTTDAAAHARAIRDITLTVCIDLLRVDQDGVFDRQVDRLQAIDDHAAALDAARVAAEQRLAEAEENREYLLEQLADTTEALAEAEARPPAAGRRTRASHTRSRGRAGAGPRGRW